MLVNRAPFASLMPRGSARGTQWRTSLPSSFPASTAALALALLPHPAHAQAWIGEYVGRLMAQQAQHQCMMGAALPDAEVAEAKGPAVATMAAYWRAVSAVPPQSVRPFFHPSRKIRWMSAGLTHTGAALGVVADPLAEPGVQPDAAPEQFVRAVQGSTARGLWRVRGASGAVLGAWLGDFSRRSGVWMLHTLTVYPPGMPPPAVTQYCVAPGDVEPYRARIAAIEAGRAEKRRRKAVERAKGRDGTS